MIVSMHVATGAAGGLLAGSPLRAALLGPVLHLLGDLVPHEDIPSLRFELVTGVAEVAALAALRGPLHPATVGAVAASVPDVEHVVRLPRPGGRKLFPTHRVESLHRRGGIPAWAQLLVAGALLGTVLGLRWAGQDSNLRPWD